MSSAAQPPAGQPGKPRASRKRAAPAAGTAGSQPGQPADAATVQNLIPDQDIRGLGNNERIAATFLFDGDTYHTVENSRAYRRMVHRQNKKDPETGKITTTLVHIVDGEVKNIAARTHATVDKRTREIGSEQTGRSYIDSYTGSDSITLTTEITADELDKTSRDTGWMTRLNANQDIRTNKYSAFRELVKAVHFSARKTVPLIKVIDQTGIVRINGKLCYANATGTVVGPAGIIANVQCKPARATAHYRDIGYAELPKSKAEKIAALNCLSELLTAYSDPGLTGILGGQLCAGLLAGTELDDGSPAASVTGVIGKTRSGKTALAMLFFTSQSMLLHGEIMPSMVVRVKAPGGSAGATPTGIHQYLMSYAGIVALLDDPMKDNWTIQHQRDAHDQIIEKTISFIVGGGSPQGQSGQYGGTHPAPPKELSVSACMPMETLGPYTNLLEDSTYNRMALVWFEKEKRCSKKIFDRLKSHEHTLKRNTGLSVVLNLLLRKPETLSAGYKLALEGLKGYVSDERVAKTYAHCLAGLHVLDAAYAEMGQITSHLATALPSVRLIVQKLEGYGTNGGDELAASDIVEATREAIRGLFADKAIYITEPTDPRDRGKPEVPQPPSDMPYGYDLSDVGWKPDGELWQYNRNTGYMVGSLYVKLPNTRGGTPAYPYRIQMNDSQLEELHDSINRVSSIRKQVTSSREERIEALQKAGVLTKVKASRMMYQLDLLWIFKTDMETLATAQEEDLREAEDNG